MAEGSDKDSGELLSDLESIRTLLDDEQADLEQTRSGEAGTGVSETTATDKSASPKTANDSKDAVNAGAARSSAEDEVPMLDDVVDLQEASHEASAGSMTDDLFASLLSDGWKDKTDDLLENARSTIDNQAEQWSPQDTDELNEALRVRIDSTIYEFLHRMLNEHIDELRAEVLDAMSDEIKIRVKQALGDVRGMANPTLAPPTDNNQG